MRLFLALNFPDDVQRAAYDAAEPLRQAAPIGVSWVAAERLHLTLKFLGEQRDDVVAPLADALRDVTRRHAPVPVELGGPGAFPNFRRPRVVWLGVRAEPKLELLHHDVEVACEGLGFEVDGRAFRPHLTLGRVREGAPADLGAALSAAARAVRFRRGAVIDSVDVMQSELGSGGSRYTVLAAAPLGRAAAE